ncbi:MAG: hypothetical protein Q7T10_03720 [Rhodoferax sp.]|uniref:hypothetical protein n=1 Tax=Rhodoferax sp. TaxID=50421 RepID=UPI002723236A|nr:hypothetical protein [Rhodoferax sp.]MDO8447896.1 hypothetical protein [Rhodoferax sp.]
MTTQRILKVLAIIAIVFGALTVFSGGHALFGDAQARASVGNAVGFVLWFNFCAGFAYVLTGVGLWQDRRWAAGAASLLALATALVTAAFGWHVMGGGAYEMRTVGALVLRLVFWVGVAALALHASKLAKMPHLT